VLNVLKRKRSEKPKILYQDESIAVLNKPAGLVVNRAETTKKQTLQDWVEKNLKSQISNLKYFRSGIIHRLDKDTSGIILIAKTREAFENLQRQFKERRIEKHYIALVHGEVKPAEGIIRVPISRSPFDRKKFGIFLGGKEAETRYKVLSIKYKGGSFYSLLELEPRTGRTHQIRVHLKYLGHPIVGDKFYAGRKTFRADCLWCPRQFLHASAISFFHPKTTERLEFYSSLPKDLKSALEYLKR